VTDRGRYQTELEWAMRHRDDPDGKTLVELAGMYQASPDHCCLGMIEGTVERIRERGVMVRRGRCRICDQTVPVDTDGKPIGHRLGSGTWRCPGRIFEAFDVHDGPDRSE